MRVYTQEDCVQQNLPENLMNRVLVLPENEMGQLFFCMGFCYTGNKNQPRCFL